MPALGAGRTRSRRQADLRCGLGRRPRPRALRPSHPAGLPARLRRPALRPRLALGTLEPRRTLTVRSRPARRSRQPEPCGPMSPRTPWAPVAPTGPCRPCSHQSLPSRRSDPQDPADRRDRRVLAVRPGRHAARSGRTGDGRCGLAGLGRRGPGADGEASVGGSGSGPLVLRGNREPALREDRAARVAVDLHERLPGRVPRGMLYLRAPSSSPRNGRWAPTIAQEAAASGGVGVGRAREQHVDTPRRCRAAARLPRSRCPGSAARPMPGAKRRRQHAKDAKSTGEHH